MTDESNRTEVVTNVTNVTAKEIDSLTARVREVMETTSTINLQRGIIAAIEFLMNDLGATAWADALIANEDVILQRILDRDNARRKERAK